jgi:phage terminase Nu1 subunit (DNA packaging protein)
MADGHGGSRQGAGRPQGSKSNHSRFQAARARKEEALAQLRELELAKQRGELLDRQLVCSEWQRLVGIARSHLISIPARVGGQCGHEVAGIVKAIVWETMRELSQATGIPPERAEA